MVRTLRRPISADRECDAYSQRSTPDDEISSSSAGGRHVACYPIFPRSLRSMMCRLAPPRRASDAPSQMRVVTTMRMYAKNRRRTPLRVESLEGKTLLSTGLAMQRVAPHVSAAPIVAQVSAFSGTLTGSYSNINIPGFSHILSYSTSGTLIGIGSTRLRGTLSARGGLRPGRLAGQLILRNAGGSMTVNVYQTATTGTDTYTVARARGSDAALRGESGDLTISQSASVSVPFYVYGRATMTFSPG